MAAYAMVKPYGPFKSIIEFGTRLRRAEALLADDGRLDIFHEPVLGRGKPPDATADLVIALHVLEHCRNPKDAASDLRRMSSGLVLVEVPCLEVETEEQAFDDVNPGHLWHFSMLGLLETIGGSVVAVESVRSGPWPCNRALVRPEWATFSRKEAAADAIYKRAAERICAATKDGDAYLGDGYSLSRLRLFGAPDLPVYDKTTSSVPSDFKGRLILTPRYLPTRREMRAEHNRTDIFDPWETK